MSNTVAAPEASAPAEPVFDAERLDVYQVALEFQAIAATLIHGRGQWALRDQLFRASASIVLNIAEGAGRVSPQDKARFYGIARGSTTECAAIIDILLSRGLTFPVSCRRPRTLLVRIVQMLTKLIARMQ
ncbi:MAG TPA: four helix bundle protein [Vicinamibacteria bacterium]|jgi:four helix bundle protein